MIPASSSYSIKRALAFGRLYQPAIGRMMILYPIISLLLSVLTIMLGYSKTGIPFIALISLGVTCMLYFSPLVFVAGGDPVIETLLPAKGSEKAAFILTMSLIVFPVLVWLPQQIVELVFRTFFPEYFSDNFFYNLQDITTGMKPISYLQVLVPTVTCLVTVVRERRRRIVVPVIWSFVSMIGLALSGMIIGFVKFFRIGYDQASQGLDPYTDTEEINQLVQQEIGPILNIMAVICAIYIIVMAIIAYRKISNRQI